MKRSSILTNTFRNSYLLFIFFLIFSTSFSTEEPFRGVSWAQEFPSREIKLVVTHGAGGGVDIPARIFSGKAEKIFGVPIVVVNNTAGGGVVGTLSVIQAKPDGYTLLYTVAGTIITKEILTPDLPYKHTDLMPICQAVVMPVALFVQNDAPWKTLKEMVDYAKKNPGKLRATVAGAGGFMDVLINLFKAEAGVDITVIPTKGGLAQSSALMGGHSELCVDTIANNVDFLRAGRLRAIVGTHKIPGFPMIKTFEDEGYPRVSLKLWHGFFGPKGLPKPILTKLTSTLEKAINDPSLLEQLNKLNILPSYKTPEETSKFIEHEYEVTLKILKQSGVVK